jgi:hypothetical protein
MTYLGKETVGERGQGSEILEHSSFTNLIGSLRISTLVVNEAHIQYSRQHVLTIKGTVSRVFLLLVFFMNQFPPSPRVSH